MSDKAKKKDQYFWWKGDSLKRIADLAQQAVDAGGWLADYEMEDGSRYLEAYRADGTEIGGENDSHVCPPSCPP